jgi:hypothetical protein
MTCRCRDCGRTFRSDRDADLCSGCRALEDAGLEVAGRAVEREEPAPRRYSRAWMREYLGVTGHFDE